MRRSKNKTVAIPKSKEHSLLHHIKKEWRLYSLMIIPILYYIIFKYVPVLGNLIAFRRYKGGPNIFVSIGLDFVTLNSSSEMLSSGRRSGIHYV